MGYEVLPIEYYEFLALAVSKMGSASRVTQVPVVHEFGHFLGLQHLAKSCDVSS
jgi:predicted Zn-dependent protease